jgi:hypothetical protein
METSPPYNTELSYTQILESTRKYLQNATSPCNAMIASGTVKSFSSSKLFNSILVDYIAG